MLSPPPTAEQGPSAGAFSPQQQQRQQQEEEDRGSAEADTLAASISCLSLQAAGEAPAAAAAAQPMAEPRRASTRSRSRASSDAAAAGGSSPAGIPLPGEQPPVQQGSSEADGEDHPPEVPGPSAAELAALPAQVLVAAEAATAVGDEEEHLQQQVHVPPLASPSLVEVQEQEGQQQAQVAGADTGAAAVAGAGAEVVLLEEPAGPKLTPLQELLHICGQNVSPPLQCGAACRMWN